MDKHIYAFLGFFVLGFGAIGAGCGSDVSSSGASGSSGSSSSSSSGSLGPRQACYDFCHEEETQNCPLQPSEGCTASCDNFYTSAPGQCSDALDALFACYLPYGGACLDQPPAECKAQQDALDSCKAQYGCLDGGECFGGSGPDNTFTCGCAQLCQMKEYKTDCIQDAMGINCTCSADGVMLGSCQPMALECSVTAGCCADIFFPK